MKWPGFEVQSFVLKDTQLHVLWQHRQQGQHRHSATCSMAT